MQSYKEFIKSKEKNKSLQKEKKPDNIRERPKREPDKKERKEKSYEREDPKEIPNEKEEQGKKKIKGDSIRHDIRDQALGRMSGVTGSNLDYDELDKMAKNHIRDVDELVSESLQNDGYTINEVKEIREVENDMKTFLHEGTGLDKIRHLNQEHDTDIIARAYVNVAKEASVRDVPKLERISEICDFEHPAYERVFDRLQAQEPGIGELLDKLDMAMGRERD